MEIRIVRSRRRKKTIEARQIEGRLEILAPAFMTDEELRPHIKRLKTRILKRVVKSELNDGSLQKRAELLNKRYFGNMLRLDSIKWVTNQEKRFGSCTPGKRSIRISHMISAMPRFVIDYVIIHELAHLKEANHGRKFWDLVYLFPKAERARGYLMAVGMEQMEE